MRRVLTAGVAVGSDVVRHAVVWVGGVGLLSVCRWAAQFSMTPWRVPTVRRGAGRWWAERLGLVE